MKMRFTALCTALTLLVGAVSLASCGHKHDYVWEEITPATCTEDGLRRGTCKDGDDTVNEIIPARGHDYDINNKCKNCGYVIPVTEGLGFIHVSGGYAAALGTAYEAKEIYVPAYYQYEPVVAVYAEGFRLIPSSETSSVPATFEKIWLPDGIETIGERAFYGCADLAEVTFPATLKEIGKNAFGECTALKKANIPRDLETVGEGAFMNCGNLETAPLSSGLKTVGAMAFMNCASLTNLNMAPTLTALGERAFYGCAGLTHVVVGTGIDALPGELFASCGNLKQVVLQTKIKSIGANVFDRCALLEEINYPGTVAEWNAIEKAFSWDGSYDEIGFYTVRCTDGNVEKIRIPDPDEV